MDPVVQTTFGRIYGRSSAPVEVLGDGHGDARTNTLHPLGSPVSRGLPDRYPGIRVLYIQENLKFQIRPSPHKGGGGLKS